MGDPDKVTQGPDPDKVTQGPDPDKVTQGPDQDKVAQPDPDENLFWLEAGSCAWSPAGLHLNLSYDEGGHIVPPQSVFIFLPKISPPDQTLRPTCKFLILGLLYHDLFSSENSVYKKFYYIN